MRFRFDIDGMRAVAIVPIVLFHAGLKGLSGGFVGVDVFFVISGFLITSIIMRDMELKRFSIVEFYRRRILRIVPALFVMLVAVLVVGAATMLPMEARGLGQSAAAAASFVSNIFFYNDADYFAGSADLKPLLHTWSLGVEEQFYLFFPLVLLAIRRLPRPSVRIGVLALCILSVLIAIVLQRRDQAAAFYLLPSRVWELGLGALVAIGFIPKLAGRARIIAASVGVVLIIAGYAVAAPGRMFPVPLAMLPCFGTALIIAYGEATFVGRLLSLRAFTAIGAISYSLYLWHWPIIAFYRLHNGLHVTPIATVGLVALSFALAIASRQFVEVPFMRGFKTIDARRIVAGGVAGLLVVVGTGLTVTWNADNWRAIPDDVRHVGAFADYGDSPKALFQFRHGICFATTDAGYDENACLQVSDSKPNMLVLGDSHAAQYWRAIAERFPDDNVMQATASGCKPVQPTRGQQRCVDVMDQAFDKVIDPGSVDTLIIIARWKMVDVAPLAATIEAVRPKVQRIVVIGLTVEYDGEFPELLARAMLRGDTGSVAEFRLGDQWKIERALAAAVTKAGAEYVSALDIECPPGKSDCMLMVNGSPMQTDYGHLSLDGSRYVIGRMAL
ncbi:MAG TPA: acyltransferase family protein [Kaistia sp.]|nr:acyltransferase family protein [Kaistia sp.]